MGWEEAFEKKKKMDVIFLKPRTLAHDYFPEYSVLSLLNFSL